MIALITFAAMNIVTWIRRPADIELRDASALDLAILGAALTGGAIGFLWYNAFPAEVIMGDTGSMALGGAIGAFAVMTKTELLLLLIGGIFVVEAGLGDPPGRLVPLLGPAHLPDGADPPPLRDESLVRDEDHGPFLDPRRDHVRRGLRVLLPLLPRLPSTAMSWLVLGPGALGAGGGPRASATRRGGDRSRCVAGPRRRQACRVGRRKSISGPRRSVCSTASRH
jgi:hypothetical protein